MASSGINPTNSNGIYARAEETAYVAAEQLHRVFNGTAEEEVMADDGLIPSVRKALVDNFYFLDPIAWEVDVTESVFNQPRVFTNPTAPEDVTYWWSPSARSTAPTPMGGSPFGDDNWQPWISGFDDGRGQLFWVYKAEDFNTKLLRVPFKFSIVNSVYINGVYQNPEDAYAVGKKRREITLSQTLDKDDYVFVLFGLRGGIVPSLIKTIETYRNSAEKSADRAEDAAAKLTAALSDIDDLKLRVAALEAKP